MTLEVQLKVPDHVPPDRVFDFDMYVDPRLSPDLYPGYATLIESAPGIFYTPRNEGHWVVTDYTLMTEILRDSEHFSTRSMAIPRLAEPTYLIPLTVDPPENMPYRQILMPFFSPKAIREMEPVIRGWAAHFLDKVIDARKADFMEAIASRFPVIVFMELMGLPLDRFDDLRAMVEEFFQPISEERRYALTKELGHEIDGLIAMRRANPGADLMSHMLSARIDERLLNDDELRSMSFLLMLGGMDTVSNTLTFSYRALGASPRLQDRLHEDPDSIAGFVDEGVRLYGVTNTPRGVIRDCDTYGVPFRTGDMLLCTLPMVGHDPRQNPDPETIDPARAQKTHLTFSVGPHLCLGHILARTEMRILTEEWVKRVRRFRVTDGFRPVFRTGTVMGIEALPLEWEVIA